MSVRLCGREIDLCIFDVDGTVYPQSIVSAAYLPVQTYLAELLLLAKTGQTTFPSSVVESKRQAYVKASITKGDFHNTFVAMGGNSDNYKPVERMVHTENYLDYDPQLSELFSRLKISSELAILTQGREQKVSLIMDKLLGHGWRSLFAAIVCGDTPGSPTKPDPEAIQYILDKTGIAPRRTVMIGDTDSADIQPARQKGLLTVQVSRTDSASADLYIKNVTDLAQHIQIT